MKNVKVGVIAGTPVDTTMGVEFLLSKGMSACGYPVSSSPEEQSKLQILSPVELTYKIREIIKEIKAKGIDTIMVYCNSLSGAVDMNQLSIEEDIRIVTPLTVYKKIAHKYKNIGVITANNQSSASIEKVVQSINPNCNVIGIGILPLVLYIEKGICAEDIVEKFSLKNILEFYKDIGVDVIILGCTHFSYIYDELERYVEIPMIDPSESMIEMVKNCK